MKFMKKLTCMFVASAMLVSMMAASASAAISYDKTKVGYYCKGGNNYSYIYINGLGSKDTIKKSSVKTSNKKVVSLSGLYKYSSKYKYEYFDGGKTSSGSNYSYNIEVLLKGAGSSTVSFKVGNKTYQTKYKVYKYTNPLKSLTIKGINGGKNVASDLNSTNSVSKRQLSKTQTNATISITAKSGWKITWAYYSGDNISRYVSSSKGLSKVTLHPSTLKKGDHQYVTIDMTNTKTGGTISLYYNFS